MKFAVLSLLLFLTPLAQVGEYEVSCPAGMIPLLQTRNIGTDKLKAIICSDDSGSGYATEAFIPLSSAPFTEIMVSASPGAPGNFTAAHGLGHIPHAAIVEMTSGGAIWFQQPSKYDRKNLYLVASDAAATADIILW